MKLNYRPDIDGLRAIAVLSVIIYHAEINILGYNLLSAGFLGVDIFFVISGYLISLIIINEKKLTGKFSFKNFYERRFRRLIPNLIIVIIFSIPFAFVLLNPTSLVDYSKSLISALGFFSNLYFHFTGLIYGTVSNSIFLHTWTLAVEEQFYILFPIFFLICLIVKRKLIIISIIVTMTIISILISIYLNNHYKSFNFYILPSRGWEFLSGVIIALLHSNFRRQKNLFVDNFFSIIGIFFIILSLFLFKSELDHPSLKTIPVVIGSSLIIYSNPKTYVNKFLSNKYLVYIGLISYSLYLWHNPIFGYSAIYHIDEINIINKFLLILLTFILSIASYSIIEKPFRNKIKIPTRKFFLITISGIVLVISIQLIVIFNNGFSNRLLFKGINLDNKYLLNEWRDFESQYVNYKFKENNKNKILIIGNSHGQDLFNVFKFNKSLNKKYEIAMFRTQIFQLVNIDNKRLFNQRDINNLNEANIIFIATKWLDKDLNIIEDSIEKLKKINNAKIYITSHKPEFPQRKSKYKNMSILTTIIDSFIINNNKLPNKDESLQIRQDYYNKQLQNKRIEKINSFLIDLSNKTETHYYDIFDYVCDKELKECNYLNENNKKIMFDESHFTISGAKSISEKLNLNIIFKK